MDRQMATMPLFVLILKYRIQFYKKFILFSEKSKKKKARQKISSIHRIILMFLFKILGEHFTAASIYHFKAYKAANGLGSLGHKLPTSVT